SRAGLGHDGPCGLAGPDRALQRARPVHGEDAQGRRCDHDGHSQDHAGRSPEGLNVTTALADAPASTRRAADTTLAVSCRNLQVRFFTPRRAITALQGLSLEVPAGEFLTLLGPSGCGKSTFLRVVADLIPPGAGEVRVFGAAPEAARLRRDIGFVFPDPALLPRRSALAHVELPLQV